MSMVIKRAFWIFGTVSIVFLMVITATSHSVSAQEKSQDKYDEEQRVWYVGVTRTKQNLYIMTAKREDRGYDIESLG